MTEYAEESGDVALEIFEDGVAWLKIDKTLQILKKKDLDDLVSVIKDLQEHRACPAGVSFLKPV